MSADGLERLRVWQMARELATLLYQEVLPLLPEEEKWGLRSQIRRSAVSIAANIAEGYGRYHFQDNIRFCYLARGSLEELYSHLTIITDVGYINGDTSGSVQERISELRKSLNGYIRHLKRRSVEMKSSPSESSIGEGPDKFIEADFLDAEPFREDRTGVE